LGNALEVLAFTGSGISNTFTTLTGVGSDSATIRNYRQGSGASLLQFWAGSITAGETQILSPEMNDVKIGLRENFRPLDLSVFSGSGPTVFNAGVVSDYLLSGFPEPLSAQQALTIQMTTSGSDTSSGLGLLVYYNDIPGIQQSLISPSQVASQFVKNAALNINTAAGVQYSTTSAAFNATTTGNLVNNTNYALLGYTTSNDALVVGFKGPFSSNLHIGGPGDSFRTSRTSNYFVDLSLRYGMPLIPVFNSADLAGTFVETVPVGPSQATRVNLVLAQLRGQI